MVRTTVHLVNPDRFAMMKVAHPSTNPSFIAPCAGAAGCRSFLSAEIASRSPTGESGSSPSARCPPALRPQAAEAGRRRPILLGLAVQGLERLAIGAGDRETGNRNGLASQRFPTVLDLHIAQPTTLTPPRP